MSALVRAAPAAPVLPTSASSVPSGPSCVSAATIASLRLRLAVDKSALIERFAAARPSATAATVLVRGLS